ncbi:hypothetical protein [Candidatus Williamhamiltonella defendens]|uniref:hypothetical protein n=1 Tax=Candidatus Williamhamiltonella defendens TaxID=138072 RepID=UPI00130E93FF|nr:hypothetical protein [Candidatus Hamiltonella defensa]
MKNAINGTIEIIAVIEHYQIKRIGVFIPTHIIGYDALTQWHSQVHAQVVVVSFSKNRMTGVPIACSRCTAEHAIRKHRFWILPQRGVMAKLADSEGLYTGVPTFIATFSRYTLTDSQ